ncbi:hypothetical protein ACSSS7_005338 [Eimeria intestinalis]
MAAGSRDSPPQQQQRQQQQHAAAAAAAACCCPDGIVVVVVVLHQQPTGIAAPLAHKGGPPRWVTHRSGEQQEERGRARGGPLASGFSEGGPPSSLAALARLLCPEYSSSLLLSLLPLGYRNVCGLRYLSSLRFPTRIPFAAPPRGSRGHLLLLLLLLLLEGDTWGCLLSPANPAPLLVVASAVARETDVIALVAPPPNPTHCPTQLLTLQQQTSRPQMQSALLLLNAAVAAAAAATATATSSSSSSSSDISSSSSSSSRICL